MHVILHMKQQKLKRKVHLKDCIAYIGDGYFTCMRSAWDMPITFSVVLYDSLDFQEFICPTVERKNKEKIK